MVAWLNLYYISMSYVTVDVFHRDCSEMALCFFLVYIQIKSSPHNIESCSYTLQFVYFLMPDVYPRCELYYQMYGGYVERMAGVTLGPRIYQLIPI